MGFEDDDIEWYAIKEISADLTHENLDKLKNEVKVLEPLSHPNIVEFADSFTEGACFYIVLEFCNAGDLNDFILNNKLNYLIKLSFTEQIFEGLSYLNERKIIHRDIKPDNIMINYTQNRYTIKIADFGLSRFCQNVTGEEPYYEFSYSPKAPLYYSAPECFSKRSITMDNHRNTPKEIVINGKVTATSDIFSLGCLIMAMFSETTVPWVEKKPLLAPFIIVNPPIQIASATPEQTTDYIRKVIKIPGQPVMEKKFQALIVDMVESDWRDRPNAKEARDRMQTLLRSPATNQAGINYPQAGKGYPEATILQQPTQQEIITPAAGINYPLAGNNCPAAGNNYPAAGINYPAAGIQDI
ncbi:serine/threonine-protein kinase PDIK1L-like [Patella vulgata]|uniref:serine/threonine-protein kinase PDIK1L-like n=1 Tax=Patella vulgata TaxID=6465 RepID=UPI00217FB2AA|nr:serine/threonine-protein kinase PDIK1L-like [Patella vulgata]